MARKTRLDAELVRRGLARSRQHALDLLNDGKVTVGGLPARKASTGVDPATSVRVRTGEQDDVVSRGAHKLTGALEAWPQIPIEGRRALDAGASTGGFTQTLLRRGAREVVAADIGYGQLAWELQTDPRVLIRDRTNVRDLTPADIGGPVDLVVADLSFISLTLVLPALAACATPDADLLVMVKPQFESGPEAVGEGGVVRDPALRAAAVARVAVAAAAAGLGCEGVVASPLPGPAGNVEYFLWLRRGDRALTAEALTAAIETGPQ
jgi:23S rRNA (cytidine1920-2'-O)/16S rRNA (cytidine1409-2'-O)-methyltransferase